jgi:DUF1680 family protein
MHVKTNRSTFARLQALPLDSAVITGGFWAGKQNLNGRVTLWHGYDMLEKAGHMDNFRVAAGRKEGEYQGYIYYDSDAYKWLEAVAYELARQPDAALEKLADEFIELLAAVQAEDGYLNSHFQVTGKERLGDLMHDHELYCAGHLMQAAVAHHRATGKTALLAIARRLADYLDAVFGPDKRQGTSGHPEIEPALVELYRETGEKRYLDLALYFVNQRGQGKMDGYGLWGSGYHQDRVPVREATEVEGHVVRQLYLNAGVTDLYLETGEAALLAAMQRLWQDMTTGKMHLTAGFGARHFGESFGEAYELPSRTAYCETCAAIAAMMWNWRMLLATGEAAYADILERSLYNGFLSCLAQDGRSFFYINPLESLGGVERQEWYACACCPPNFMRQIATVGHYLATVNEAGVQIHQYASARLAVALTDGRQAALRISTDYPWHGTIQITIEETDDALWTLSLRIPGWCREATLQLNGQPVTPAEAGTYAQIERIWQPGDVVELELPMPPRLTRPHPYVEHLRGMVAIERGPVVYCLEGVDQEAGLELRQVSLAAEADLQEKWQEDLLGGVMTVAAAGLVTDLSQWAGQLYRPQAMAESRPQPVRLVAVPYFAWANRDIGAMRVWLPHPVY